MYPPLSREGREAFWKTFGRYMALVPSASGERINWINYKTGVKGVRFSLEAERGSAKVIVSISDAAIWEKLRSLQELFQTITGEDWAWGNYEIYTVLEGKDIRQQEDWPELITFFKQRMIQLDAFWTEVKDIMV